MAQHVLRRAGKVRAGGTEVAKRLKGESEEPRAMPTKERNSSKNI
jgi:hypothetical protein